MSIDYSNQNFQLDGYSFDDYFNALISPVPTEKKPEAIMMELNKYKDTNNKNSEIKNPLKLEYSNLHPQLPNLLNNNLIPKINNKNVPNKNTPTKTVKKRKVLAETSRDVPIKPELKQNPPKQQLPQLNEQKQEVNVEQQNQDPQEKEQDQEQESEQTTSSTSSPTKKSKKNPKNPQKKKKDAPKRKRVNYCFEIHRSGCSLNKDSKLYCKVFLKGKLQSEVDLIKGARGKWAYTFYDQRKKKKERRYWPSQSSGPVIEDPCYCEKCIPNNKNLNKNNNNNTNNKMKIKNEEAEFSSPSTEEATLIEYEQMQTKDNHFGINHVEQYSENQVNQYIENQDNQYIGETPDNSYFQNQYVENQFVDNQYVENQDNQFVQNVQNVQNPHFSGEQQNHIVYYFPPNYQPNNERQYSIRTSNEYQNMVLKSSNDFQDRSHYLKSSNDFVNQQRNWELQQSNNGGNEYQNDSFFVENNFL